MEKTLVLIKPDAVQRRLSGEIINRLERKGLKLTAMKLMQMSREMAMEHYQEHEGKSFFESLVNFITSSPLIAMVWEGTGAVSLVRQLMGETDPQKASPGTIRGDLAIFTGTNLVHGSDSVESAEREIKLFFAEDELLEYHLSLTPWVEG